MKIKKSDYPELNLSQNRVPDLIDMAKKDGAVVGTLHEIKSGKMNTRDFKQFDDYMEFAGKKGGSPVQVGGKRVVVNEVKYTFTDASALKDPKTQGWLVKKMKDHNKLKIEVFDAKGIKHDFGQANKSELKTFLEHLS